MQARIDNPVFAVPGALDALTTLHDVIKQGGLSETVLGLVELRASQINGCSICADIHWRELRLAGERDERIFAVATWRETDYFDDAERAVLALTEAATRLADRPEAVPDEVWDEAARHFDQRQLAAVVLAIASINAWNRINATTRQISGEWVGTWVEDSRAARETV